MTFLDTGCAELLTGPDGGWDADLAVCALPLEAVARHVLPSTHGPVDHLTVQCPRGHRYTHVAPRHLAADPRADDAGQAEAA